MSRNSPFLSKDKKQNCPYAKLSITPRKRIKECSVAARVFSLCSRR
jgi:hypothetical protein